MRPLKQAVYSSRTADKFVVRLPDGMREKIAEVARGHHRSMNSEIISRLERSILEEEAVTGVEQPIIGHIDEIIQKLDVQPWVPQVGQVVRRRDNDTPLGTIKSFRLSNMGLMATIEVFVVDGPAVPDTHQAVGLLEPVDIFEVIQASAGPVHKALERIAAK
jgi:hypothetical protein